MAALTVSAVRLRVAAAIEALSGDWTETDLSPVEFPVQTSAGHVHPFMVAVPSTERSGFGSSDTGALVDTVLEVDWFTLRTKHDFRTGLATHLTAEQVLILGVLAVSKADLAISWRGTTRDVDGEWVRGRTEFLATHSLAFVTNP